LKNIRLASEGFKIGSRVVHHKTMQNLSTKVSKRVPWHLWKKKGPRRPPRLPHLMSTPALNYIQQQELFSFYNII